MPGYQDPVAWLDAFYAAFRSANGGRDPTIDYLGFHWYDYGLGGQLDRLTKYGKPFWVTEFANWHSGDGAAQIDTARQAGRADDRDGCAAARRVPMSFATRGSPAAWASNDTDAHFTSLLKEPGVLQRSGGALHQPAVLDSVGGRPLRPALKRAVLRSQHLRGFEDRGSRSPRCTDRRSPLALSVSAARPCIMRSFANVVVARSSIRRAP